MIVSIKDALKLVVVSVMAACAVFISTLFLNYNMDLSGISDQIIGMEMETMYTAMKKVGIVISCISGGSLLVTTIIMLIFFIRNYIDTHKKELGILKAMGYSNFRIARSFWVFGISVLAGTAAGFIAAFLFMGKFYEVQNKDSILPDFTFRFHPALMVCLVILPAVFFAAVAIFYAALKLRTPVLGLIRDTITSTGKQRKHKDRKSRDTFIGELKSSTLRSRKSLVFFIIFGSFCFSAMTQMSVGVRDVASDVMGYMVLIIGIVLALVTLYLAVSTVISGNRKTAAMMKVFGYSDMECRKSVLDCYRPMAYIGFAIGTLYQYFLLKLSVAIVCRDLDEVPEVSFDVPVMLLSLVGFIAVYELFMWLGLSNIRKISIKEVMLES